MKHKDIYKSLSDHDSNGVYSLDTEGRFRSFNPAAEHITGFQSQDLQGLVGEEGIVARIGVSLFPQHGLAESSTPSRASRQTSVGTLGATRRGWGVSVYSIT